MKTPQKSHVSVRVLPEDKERFEKYAASMGIGVSELLRLLITREYHRKRLSKVSFRPERRRGTKNAPLPTVTAHLSSAEDVEQFDAYAKGCGTNRNGAGAWLIRTELTEKWLKKAIYSQ